MDLSDLALIFPTVERTLLGELLAFNGGDIERTAAAILDVGFPSDLDEPNDSSMAAQEALDAALARQTQQQFDEEFIAAQEGAAQEGAANATMPTPSGRQDPVSTSGSAAAKGKRMNLKLVALKRKSKGAKKEGQRDSLLPQGYIGQSDQSDAPGSPAAGADSFRSPPAVAPPPPPPWTSSPSSGSSITVEQYSARLSRARAANRASQTARLSTGPAS
mmetsp:Transcript_44298/g.143749  ORF Transcript_44298/g.143749 Transcript_44298/m.143749 type:complete len:218 (-) Transcript_44298:37-690(-)